ncbi:MAG: methyltransferase domain-containing protein [Methylococcaceae bacterium]|nr:methyltransferase domain-containing protein [Methylococcaceae bacterium]MDP3902945.1 methyltransferase domain-containing protein [Methylococcaceae bacterium]
MKRNFLFSWYQTPRGKLLKELEVDYLQRAITVSCQQTILQIGGLGWENEFIDSTLYKKFIILDSKQLGSCPATKIQAKSYLLPLQSNSFDMILLPHLLEFDEYRFQTMREIERVLKPEGVVVIINFNPWSLWVRYQFLWDKKMSDSWRGHFISQTRVLDWLKLLNFEVTTASGFYLNSVKSTQGKSIRKNCTISATAYGIRAVKRRYNLIPLTPIKAGKPRLAMANTITSTKQIHK